MRDGNLSLRLTHLIGKDIVNGTYPIMKELPTEAEFCTRYDVSRTVLREAFKMLSAKGMLSARPRRGTRVEPSDNWLLFDPDILSWLQQTTPSLNLLKEFNQLRQAIEPEAAALAIQNYDEEKIQNIGEALEQMKYAQNGLADPLESDIAFHVCILRASGNRFYLQLTTVVETALRFSIFLTNRVKGVDSADYEEHLKVYTAIVERDADEARNRLGKMLADVDSYLNHAISEAEHQLPGSS